MIAWEQAKTRAARGERDAAKWDAAYWEWLARFGRKRIWRSAAAIWSDHSDAVS